MKNKLIVTTGTGEEIVDATTFKVKINSNAIEATIAKHVSLDFPIHVGETVPIDMSHTIKQEEE